MMKKGDSRGPQLDNEKCVENAGHNRFNLVVVASERLRELRRQNQHSDKIFTAVDALLDVQEGKIDPNEYLGRVKRSKK